MHCPYTARTEASIGGALLLQRGPLGAPLDGVPSSARRGRFWVLSALGWVFNLWALAVLGWEFKSAAELRMWYFKDVKKKANQFSVSTLVKKKADPLSLY